MIKIELKSIKTLAGRSEETHCYTADLYVDGVKWGSVGNSGHGGQDDFHGTNGKSYADLPALNARIGAEYPRYDMTDIGCPGETMAECLETVCGGLVNDFLELKSMNRKFKNRLVFQDPKGALYQVSLKGRTAAAVIATHSSHPGNLGCVYLNTMPEAEALAIFRKAA
jgi:hypothetical protein